MSTSVPELRTRGVNTALVRDGRDFVLYWMTAFRRPHWNFALQWAADLAEELGKPLVVLEALRSDYRWASDRLHAFVLQGMADNARAFAPSGALYYPYVEPTHRAGKGLLAALGAHSCAVVSDDFPCFFLPRMLAAAGKRLDVTLTAVDSNGLYPMRATERVFPSAHTFRRHLHKQLVPHLYEMPEPDPLAQREFAAIEHLPASIQERWPRATEDVLAVEPGALEQLPIDHSVTPSPVLSGGHIAATDQLTTFVDQRLVRYHEDRNQPDNDPSSGLSPYLHFGHISAHEVFHTLVARENWSPDDVAAKPSGSREGWWNLAPSTEAFLDELITWRELGFNMSSKLADYARFESLPDFAKRTLDEHRADEREFSYSLDEFDAAATHDKLWNAAQRQLVREGRMHNYLRMLWGKKVLEWSATPEAALETLIELNNRYALDGRNPNSYSGIFWCLGRYDRAWGPERPVFGKIRFMSSDSTARKLRLKSYLERYSDAPAATNAGLFDRD